MRPLHSTAVAALIPAITAVACASTASPPSALDPGKAALGDGRWQDALTDCTPSDQRSLSCDQSYCSAIAQTMLFVDELDAYIIPTFSGGLVDIGAANAGELLHADELLTAASTAVDAVAARGCSYDLPHLPLVIGASGSPLVDADVRGEWTPRSAELLGAILASIRFIFASNAGPVTVPPADASGVPGLPDLLQEVYDHVAAEDALLWSQPADPTLPRGGWLDRDGDGAPSAGDELLIDLFVPGTDTRVFDFSSAELVKGESLALGSVTPTASLPVARCGYAQWHVTTLVQSADVGTTDGLSFSPDGTKLVFPMKVNGTYEIHVANADASSPVCITCGGTPSWNDGVRWRPGSASTLLFISNRDHAGSVGGAGGGAGQELYAMRADGSEQTRLTTSDAWATNYHANWSADGQHVVWGSTEARTWDVMVADFVDDAGGMRLVNTRRIVHDTTWWETHGFTHDGSAVITTNTRAGLLSSDIYAVDLASGARTRLTNDVAWDEHAHLSPDGREMSWISARWRPASMDRIVDGSLSPIFDFFWIDPGIFFAFESPPSGFATELTLMDADGSNIRRLTTDDEIVADNEWSPDGTQIVFRQTPNATTGPAAIRLLTFDDCP